MVSDLKTFAHKGCEIAALRDALCPVFGIFLGGGEEPCVEVKGRMREVIGWG